jgi:membrane dipeptidase
MTFATDYQRGDAYDRFLKGLASMDRQLKGNDVNRSLSVRTAHKNRQPTVIQAVEGGHFPRAILSGSKKPISGGCDTRPAPR